MSFDLTGVLHAKYETEQVSATFKKREFVVRYSDNPSYPQFIKLQLVQDKCSELDKHQPGDAITVSFNLQGREWIDPKTQEKKYFTSLNAWRIVKASATDFAAPVQGGEMPPVTEEDLPF